MFLISEGLKSLAKLGMSLYKQVEWQTPGLRGGSGKPFVGRSSQIVKDPALSQSLL